MAVQELPKTRLDEFVPGRTRRFRVKARSRVIGGTFSLINALTRYDMEGRENLIDAVSRARASGRGLLTVSNHLSLFDDPMVQCAVLGLRNVTVETKCWWSTACASNFDPHEPGLRSKVVRMFSEASNMVFFARAYKGCKASGASRSLAETLRPRLGWKRFEALERRAAELGTDVEGMLRGWKTAREGEEPTSLDQLGIIESCARLAVGDWLQFFPEGGRSRSLSLRPARPGVGKVIYHSPGVEVVPICFYGTQDVLPIGAVVPRPFKRVVVRVGRPIGAAVLDQFRAEPPTPRTFLRVAEFAMAGVGALRPEVLARYMGAEAAAKLIEEEQAEMALATAQGAKVPSDRPTVPPPPLPADALWACTTDERPTDGFSERAG
ncbi:MAG: lysophospholipid acyltransferase family protein [Myxococcota bacterium]|nr:lysophospholipid acyltransferase family protein [Myxococcota bacterium]